MFNIRKLIAIRIISNRFIKPKIFLNYYQFMKSPFIKKQICGRVEVEGQEDGFKDVKLFPGGSRELEWAETSNHHSPGIQVADTQEILDKDASTLVLSNGV